LTGTVCLLNDCHGSCFLRALRPRYPAMCEWCVMPTRVWGKSFASAPQRHGVPGLPRIECAAIRFP